jgi:hypothetical protein
MQQAKRKETRVKAVLPIQVEDGQSGMTRDLCPSGVFFETDKDFELGAPIRFSIEFESPHGPLRLDCRGEVARVEKGTGRRGIAARILDSRWNHNQKTVAAVTPTRSAQA